MGLEKAVPKVVPASTETREHPNVRDLFQADEHAWIAAQISALSRGQFGEVDRPNLVAVLSEMTVRDRRELQSRLTGLLHHLLKVRFQRGRLSRSWIATILEQQREVRAIVEGIPSLGRQAETIAALAYPERGAGGFPRYRPAGLGISGAGTVDKIEQALAFDPPEPAARGRRPRG